MVAFDADGEGAVRVEDDMMEGERNEMDTPAVQAALRKMAERHKGEKWTKEQLAALGKRIAARGKKAVKEEEIEEGWKSKLAGAALAGAAALGSGGANAADVNDPSWSKAGYDSHVKADSSLTKTTSSDGVSAPKVSKDLQRRISDVTGPNADGQYRVTVTQNGKLASQYVTKTPPPGWLVKESADNITKEDIISKLKARLGDYLSDISKEIKKDPDLVDKLSAKAPGDQMGPPVKTVTTDDGKEIQIHGNEDDGFRISIKNRPAKTKFKNLDEAVMACEIYCARQRNKNSDYLDEA
jgi:ribosomal protein L11